MSMTEYTQHRMSTSWELKQAYEELCRIPQSDEPDVSADVLAAMEKVQDRYSLDSDQGWLLQLCSTELLQQFGGMSIVDKGLLPLGVMTMLRSKNVTWQEVL